MLFSSLQFICMFFPVFFACYYAAMFIDDKIIAARRNPGSKPKSAAAVRNIVLLIFSLFFYAMGQPENLLLIAFSLFFNYTSALAIDACGKIKKLPSFILAINILTNFGLLGYYKYTGFFFSVLAHLGGINIDIPSIVLPIGISFFTFQIVSYVIDVYRRQVQVQTNILMLAVYLVSFPQLIAEPIVRYSDIETQLVSRHESVENVSSGLCRFIIGLSKKVIIANTVSVVADGLFSRQASEIGMIGSWLAVICYTLQIYYDFSGYSDMAIGMGAMMGFTYLENFNYPYAANTITDFWHRWHMSLSSFFRDYVYIPLGGNRVSPVRHILNIMIVWSLTGLWHGAAYTFILWGVYYGVLLIIEKYFLSAFLNRHAIISRVYTVFAIIVGWVIFRADDLHAMKNTILAMSGVFGISGDQPISYAVLLQQVGVNGFFVAAFILGVIFSAPPRGSRSIRMPLLNACNIPISKHYINETDNRKLILSRTVCFILLLICIVLLEIGSYNPFLYFQF